MYKYILIFHLYLLLSINLNAQKHEFFGAIKLNGKAETAITYKLVINEKDGKITGYSITDMSGAHETKNIIEGSYDPKKKFLKFTERDIIYTKSTVTDDLFCFISFEGKVKLNDKKPKIDGDFKGVFKDKTKCIDGTITLIGSQKLQSLLNKANKKIQNSKELQDSIKIKYNPIQVFDSLQVNQLTSKQNMSVFDNTDIISFEIWDKEKEDGDIINLYHNSKLVLSNYSVTKLRKSFDFKLDENENVFRFEAVNEGKYAPNTAMVLMKGSNPLELQSNLKKGESASITILKKKDNNN